MTDRMIFRLHTPAHSRAAAAISGWLPIRDQSEPGIAVPVAALRQVPCPGGAVQPLYIRKRPDGFGGEVWFIAFHDQSALAGIVFPTAPETIFLHPTLYRLSEHPRGYLPGLFIRSRRRKDAKAEISFTSSPGDRSEQSFSEDQDIDIQRQEWRDALSALDRNIEALMTEIYPLPWVLLPQGQRPFSGLIGEAEAKVYGLSPEAIGARAVPFLYTNCRTCSETVLDELAQFTEDLITHVCCQNPGVIESAHATITAGTLEDVRQPSLNGSDSETWFRPTPARVVMTFTWVEDARPAHGLRGFSWTLPEFCERHHIPPSYPDLTGLVIQSHTKTLSNRSRLVGARRQVSSRDRSAHEAIAMLDLFPPVHIPAE